MEENNGRGGRDEARDSVNHTLSSTTGKVVLVVLVVVLVAYGLVSAVFGG